ncbi:MAG: fasciclin domain-containing protein [Phormidesmis sp.]
MRFSALTQPFSKQSFSKQSFSKFAGIAAALMILPVAVSCATEPTAETDVTSEVPESVEGEIAADGTTSAETGNSILEVAAANGSFDTLVAAIQVAGLEEALTTEGPYTVFAPTDEAFAALPEGTVEKLVKPENQEVLGQILAYHVVAGAVPSSDIEPGAISTIEGSDIEVSTDATGVMVNGEATVTQPDIVADNGVIHVVDTVLLPPTFDPSTLL